MLSTCIIYQMYKLWLQPIIYLLKNVKNRSRFPLFYRCDIIISHTPVPARGKDKTFLPHIDPSPLRISTVCKCMFEVTDVRSYLILPYCLCHCVNTVQLDYITLKAPYKYDLKQDKNSHIASFFHELLALGREKTHT